MRKSQSFYKVYKIHMLHDTNKNVKNVSHSEQFCPFFVLAPVRWS